MRVTQQVEASALWQFFTRGGSLLVTGFIEIRPQRIARANALETTPAIFRTVFALSARGVRSLRCGRHTAATWSIRG